MEGRFEKCSYFLIVNPTTLEFEGIAKASAEQGGGAGIQSTQRIAEKGASVVLSGYCGPKALKVFGRTGIQVKTGVFGSGSPKTQHLAAGSTTSAPSA